MSQKDEPIYLVKEKSETQEPQDLPVTQWYWKSIRNGVVIPARCKVIDDDEPPKSFVWRKVKGRRSVLVYLDIDTGITLSYRGKEWRESHQIRLEIPFGRAKKLSEGMLKVVKANSKKVGD